MTIASSLHLSSAAKQTASDRWANAAHALFSLLLFVACLILYTRHNDFPYSWHPDEIPKAWQVARDRDTFFHPMLLLGATRTAVAILDVGQDYQSIVEIGRYVSAFYAAVAVLAFSQAAFLLSGYLASILAGLFIGLSPALLVNAHYMKEDTALLMGISFVVWAIAALPQIPLRKGIFLLGAACAFAASGKYVGAVFIPVAYVWIRMDSRVGALSRVSIFRFFAGGFLLVFILINFSAFLWFYAFVRGMAQELLHVAVAGHYGVRMSLFNLDNLAALLRQLIVPAQILVAFFYLRLLQKKDFGSSQTFIALIPILYFILLSVAMVHQPRYLLPVSTTLLLIAALAASDLIHHPRFGKKTAVGLAFACAILVTGFELHQCGGALSQFRNDSRYALTEWIEENLPSGSCVAIENFSGLLDPNLRAISQLEEKKISFRSVYMIGEMDTLARLRSSGVTHVVTNDLMYRRFFNPNLKPAEAVREKFNNSRKLYEDIFKQRLIWEQAPDFSLDAFTNPTLSLYDIREKR